MHDAVLVGLRVDQGLDYNERYRSNTLDRTANAGQHRPSKTLRGLLFFCGLGDVEHLT